MTRKSLTELREEMRAVVRGDRRASPLPAASLLEDGLIENSRARRLSHRQVGERDVTEPFVTLKSALTAKWPRYEIRLSPGLSVREASAAAAEALRTAQRPVVLLSQFKYDPKTGVVDTRIKT